MMATTLNQSFRLVPLAFALSAAYSCAYAQNAESQGPAKQSAVLVTGRAEPVLDTDEAQLGTSGSIKNAPQSIGIVTQGLLKETESRTLSRTLALDASLADAYNAVGYIENMQIRGFVLDSVNNYQRNGLPTLNYAPFAAENKAQIEVLKGVSGLQAAVSAPGGLVNYRVAKPGLEPLTELNLGYAQQGNKLAHLDVSRVDASRGIAIRVNALHEQLRPAVFHAEGSRSLLSAYLTWNANARTTVDVDLEWQRKSQLEQPGFGLLDADGTGNARALPRLAYKDASAIDPRTNMNAQAWSLPFEQQFWTAAVHVKHAVSDATSFRLSLQTQRLKTNDRIAFPDGAYPVYPGAAANGDMDLYDYRSENERRSLTAAQAELTHRAQWGVTSHLIRAQLQSYEQKFEPEAMQAYNWVGTTNEFHPVTIASGDPTLSYLNRPNSERVSSVMLSDAISLSAHTTLYLGLKASRLSRQSSLSDGTEKSEYTQEIATHSLGLSSQLTEYLTGYASWGQGVESEVVPNRPTDFANYGQALPALKSKQKEIGLKWQPAPRLLATAALFDIEKPYSEKDSNTSTLIAGAKRARHTGVELSASGAVTSHLSVSASAMWLHARYTQAIDASLINTRVTNVAPFSAALFADYKLDAVKGLAVNTRVRYDAEKSVYADRSAVLPSATQWDMGARYRHTLSSVAVTWRLNVENVLNSSYWREAPTQSWGGVYLFPAAPRRVSLTAQLDY